MTPEERLGVLRSLLDRVVAKASERGIDLPHRVPATAWTPRNGTARTSTPTTSPEIVVAATRVLDAPAPPPTLEDVHGAAAYAAAAESNQRAQAPLLSEVSAQPPGLLAFPDEGVAAPPLVVMQEPMPVSGIGHGPAGWGSQDSPLVTATRLAAESSPAAYEPAPPPSEAPLTPAYIERPTALVQFAGGFDDETTASGNPVEIEAMVLEEARLAQEEMERELAASGLLADDGDDDDPATMGAMVSPYAEPSRPPSELPPTSVMNVPDMLASDSRHSGLGAEESAVARVRGVDDEISSVRPVEGPARTPSLRPSAYPLELEDLDELAPAVEASPGAAVALDGEEGDRATLPPVPARVETPHLMLDQITDEGAAPWMAEPSQGHTETAFAAPPAPPASRPSREPPGEAVDEVLLDEHDVLLLEPSDEDAAAESAPLSLRGPSLGVSGEASDEAPSTEPPPTEQARESARSLEATALVAFADSAERASLGASPIEAPRDLLDEDLVDEPSGPVAILPNDDEEPVSSRQALDPARAIDDRLDGVAEPPPESGEVESQRYPVGAAPSVHAPEEPSAQSEPRREPATSAQADARDLDPVVVDRPTSEGEPEVPVFAGRRASVDLSFGELLDAALSLG